MSQSSFPLADDLVAYVQASPTPYHAVRETIRRLTPHGFRELDEREPWRVAPGDRVYVVRGETTIAAFVVGTDPPDAGGFSLIGAHTDSPNLRVKPNPEITRAGCLQLGVEVYGGVIYATWLDRDLSMAGRVFVRGPHGPVSHLVDFARPLMRIPNLAIHLNRTVNTEGLLLNAQQHLSPLCGLDPDKIDLRAWIAEELARGKDGVSISRDDVLSWDLCLYDAQPPTRAGRHGELVHAPRLDNLGSCHAAVSALLGALAPATATRGIVLYDHEECGSRSAQGADSPFLRQTLERLLAALGRREPDATHRAYARSFVISADMAHALHPNYADKHEPGHAPILGRGPVIKANANQSYATDGESWARFETWCREAEVIPQRFVTRSDLPCGSTIGPITAGQLGIRTVDVGNPMLSMHSCREMAASADVGPMIAAMSRFFAPR